MQMRYFLIKTIYIQVPLRLRGELDASKSETVIIGIN